ncbi:hypothetical protein JB92DRAFT_759940 [Gautieria morchelliformis]|nr:hypothetical protein JB92DRAFT_759940 [Gautieria morchelliformis]
MCRTQLCGVRRYWRPAAASVVCSCRACVLSLALKSTCEETACGIDRYLRIPTRCPPIPAYPDQVSTDTCVFRPGIHSYLRIPTRYPPVPAYSDAGVQRHLRILTRRPPIPVYSDQVSTDTCVLRPGIQRYLRIPTRHPPIRAYSDQVSTDTCVFRPGVHRYLRTPSRYQPIPAYSDQVSTHTCVFRPGINPYLRIPTRCPPIPAYIPVCDLRVGDIVRPCLQINYPVPLLRPNTSLFGPSLHHFHRPQRTCVVTVELPRSRSWDSRYLPGPGIGFVRPGMMAFRVSSSSSEVQRIYTTWQFIWDACMCCVPFRMLSWMSMHA